MVVKKKVFKNTTGKVKATGVKKKPPKVVAVKDKEEYGEDEVHTLEGFALQIRSRPTMYIESTGTSGVKRLFDEVITNSLDEFGAGYCKNIRVVIDTKSDRRGPIIELWDDGRGIPLSKLVACVTIMHTGGKFNDLGKGGQGYVKVASGGLNGIGMKATNALSIDFEMSSTRDGKRRTVKYSQGVLVSDVWSDVNPKKHPNGCYTRVIPDILVMDDVNITPQRSVYESFIDIMGYISAGVKIDFTWNGNRQHIYHPKGLMGYFAKIRKDKSLRMLGEPHYMEHHVTDNGGNELSSYKVIFGFAATIRPTVVAYTNGIYNSEGGSHVQTLSESLRVVTAALNKGNYIPKSYQNKIKITGDEVRGSLVAIVLAGQSGPQFSGQTKNKFTSSEYKPRLIEFMTHEVKRWISANPGTMNKLGEHTAKLARLRYDSSKTMEKAIKSGTSSSDLSLNIDVSKFTDANMVDKEPEKCELFIVEGNSAAGGAKDARDRDYQAVMALRGKIRNIYKSGNVGSISGEMEILIKVLGCGSGKDRNISNMRYGRVVILTDADDDGAHITALLTAFFWKLYPELVEQGRIVVANPPLYVVKQKGHQSLFLNTQAEYNRTLVEKAVTVFRGRTDDGIDLPDNVLRGYLSHLPTYSAFVERAAKTLAIHPLILEYLALDISNVLKGRFKGAKHYGLVVTDNTKVKDGRILSIGMGYNQYNGIDIDSNFIEQYVTPMRDTIINKARLCKIHLIGRRTKRDYGESFFIHGKLTVAALMGDKNISIKREKGLGASDFKELRQTSLDPETRYVTRLVVEDSLMVNQWVEWLFTPSEQKRAMYTVEK